MSEEYNNLSLAYTRITGKEFGCEELKDENIIDCFLSKHFVKLIPYLNKINFIEEFDNLLYEGIPYEDEYYDYVDELGSETRHDVYCPSLFTVLLYYPLHFTALNYVINNWEKFFINKTKFMFSIFHTLFISEGNARLTCNRKGVARIYKFLKNNNGIRYLNKYGDINYPHINMRNLVFLILKIDNEHNFMIRDPLKFFRECLKNPRFDKIYNNYRNNILTSDIRELVRSHDELIKSCLYNRYFDSYLVLYRAGYKLTDSNASLFRLGAREDLLYTIDDICRYNNIMFFGKNVAQIFRMSESYWAAHEKIKLSHVIRVIEYMGNFKDIDFDALRKKINKDINLHNIVGGFAQPNAFKHLMACMYCDNIDYRIEAPESVRKGVIKKYNIDIFFRYTSKVDNIKTWKFNFSSMLRFANNMSDLTAFAHS